MSNTVRQIAGSIGTAWLITVMSSRTTIHVADYANVATTANVPLTEGVAQLGQTLAQTAGISTESGSSLALQQVYRNAVTESTIHGINDAFIIATGIALAGLLFSLFLRRSTPRRR
jgi:hypothetical protein